VLVDCGRAATQRALDAGLDLSDLVAVAVTHHHSDHISDLATLAITRWSAGAATPLTVVAPEGPSARFARRCIDVYDDQAFHSQAPRGAGPRPTVEVRAFAPTASPSVVLAATGWRLSAALVDHHPVAPAVGYRVEHGGASVAVSGDTAVCAGMHALAQDIDVLVHEALLTDRVTPELLAWNAGARAVGELAARVRPGKLVLTHLIPAPASDAERDAYLTEVRAGGFGGLTLVAHDGLRIPT
jgi:ribonuclease Z